MEKIVRRRYWWFAFSLLIILTGFVFLGVFGLQQGIDFSGGALWNIQFRERQRAELNTEEIAQVFATQGFDRALVQIAEAADGQAPAAAIRTAALSTSNPEAQTEQVVAALRARYGEIVVDSIQTVGETVSTQSRLYAVFAVLGACVAILIYLTVSFRRAPNPIRYGVCTVLGMLHDVLLVLGVAAILGYFIGVEVDALFLTALLTVISFSVQDKIVVFDRVRENLLRRRPGESFDDIVNLSVAQVMPRSICTQLTSFFTLTALLLFGGASIRNFVLILMIGLVSGTYSSIFIAAQLLVVWENREWGRWFGRREPATA
jgi:preprotein translocase subunit SecF